MTVLSCAAGDSGNRHVHDLAPLLAALADPRRLRIVEAVVEGARSVDELCAACGLPGPSLQAHVRRLVEAGVLVRMRRSGGTRYRIARPEFAKWLLEGARALRELENER